MTQVRELENRMIIDSEWEHLIKGISSGYPKEQRKLNGSGYREIGSDLFVPEENAYKYALEKILQDEDLKQGFTEWFYSDNWVKED